MQCIIPFDEEGRWLKIVPDTIQNLESALLVCSC
jgi:hypothetical protein